VSPLLAIIADRIAEDFGISRADISGPRRYHPLPNARTAMVRKARRLGYTQRALAKALNRSIDGIRYAERRAA